MPRIDTSLIPIKGYYFFSNAVVSVVVPFLSVYMSEFGLSYQTIGIVFMVLFGSGTVTKTGFGLLADKFRCKKLLLLVAEIVMSIGFVSFVLVPKLEPAQNFEVVSCSSAGGDGGGAAAALDLVLCSRDQSYDEGNYSDAVHFTLSCPGSRTSCSNHSVWLSLESLGNKSTVFNDSQAQMCLKFPSRGNFTQCPNAILSSDCCRLQTNSSFLDNFVIVRFENERVFRHPAFWLLFVILIVAWTAMAVMVSLGDAICFKILGDRPSDYGKQRVFGAIGWGLFVLTSAIVSFMFGKKNGILANHEVVVTILVLTGLLNFLFSLRLKFVECRENHNLCKNIGFNVFKLKILFYFLWCFLVGVFTAAVWNYLFIHLSNLYKNCPSAKDIGSKDILLALASCVQCLIGEVPFFTVSALIINKIGHSNSMHLVSLCFGIRFLLYSVVANPWYSLPIEISNGITVGLFYPTMTMYAYAISSPGTEATMQGLSGAIFEGAGVGFGSLLIGKNIDIHRTADMYRFLGCIGIAFTVVHFFADFFLVHKKGTCEIENAKLN